MSFESPFTRMISSLKYKCPPGGPIMDNDGFLTENKMKWNKINELGLRFPIIWIIFFQSFKVNRYTELHCKNRVLVPPYLRHVLEIDMSSTIWNKENRSNKNAFKTRRHMSFSKSCLPTSDNRHVLRNWSVRLAWRHDLCMSVLHRDITFKHVLHI